MPKQEEKPIRWAQTIGVWWRAILRLRWWFFAICSVAIVANSIDALLPWTLKYLFDALATAGTSWSMVWPLLVVFGAGRLLVNVLWTVSGRLTNRFQPRVIAALEQEVFGHLLGQGPSYFHEQFTGSLVKRIGRFGRAFERVCDEVFFTAIPLVVFVVIGTVNLASRSMWLGVGYSVWVGLVIALNVLLLRWTARFDARRDAMDSRIGGLLADILSNMATVRAFARERLEWKSYVRASKEFIQLQQRSWDRHQLIRSSQEGAGMLLDVGSVACGVWLWSRGIVSVGDVVFTQLIVSQLSVRIRYIGRGLRGVSEAFSNASEAIEILETPHAIVDAQHAKPLRASRGEIVFHDVGFHYRGSAWARSVLTHVSCRIAPGEKVALVGPSGAGKSTMMKLLMRDWDTTSGTIIIDGQPIVSVTQESLRSAIGLVPQEPALFHRSIAENIRVGAPKASRAQVERAARLAHAHEFIERLPQGYDTLVGERGVKLSGGERQRVAIARAMIKNAPILLLDEATSSLDSESESLIQEALTTLMEGKTVLVIAHRLSTIMHMDRILVMKDGRIIDEGTHGELLSRTGLYQQLWSLQAGGFLHEE